VAGFACNFVYATFFLIRFQIFCCESCELLYLECYSYLGISKQVGDFPYLGTMMSECDPGPFVVFTYFYCMCGQFCCVSVG